MAMFTKSGATVACAEQPDVKHGNGIYLCFSVLYFCSLDDSDLYVLAIYSSLILYTIYFNRLYHILFLLYVLFLNKKKEGDL